MKAGTTAHREWECPQCGRTYKQTIPAFGVICPPHPKHKDFRRSVEMKPTDEPVDLNPNRRRKAA